MYLSKGDKLPTETDYLIASYNNTITFYNNEKDKDIFEL